MDASPPRWARTQLVAVAAIIGGALAYALCDWGGWTRLTFDPYLGTWSWRAGATQPVPINYYGNLLWAAGGSAAGAAIGWGLARVPALARPAARGLGVAWALTAVGLAAFYYLWSLWPF
ncbi:MAG: hypothetical protein R3B06_19865 [Kofleriaceae bacterium]